MILLFYLIFCQSTVTALRLFGSNIFALQCLAEQLVGALYFPSVKCFIIVAPHFVHMNSIFNTNGLMYS